MTTKVLLSWLWLWLGPVERAEHRGFPGGCTRALVEPEACCLRSASSRASRGSEEHRGPPVGRRAIGSPFFWLLFFGEAKKSHPGAGTGGPAHSCRVYYSTDACRLISR